MTVTDLQAWADNVELVRLPAITSDISDLTAAQALYDGKLNAKSQEFTDRLDAQSFRIDTAQTTANTADTRSNTAISRIYNVDIDATTYTNQKFQEAQNELNARFDALEMYLSGDYSALVDTKIDGEKTSFQQTVDAAVAQAIEARDSLNTNLNDMEAVNNTITNIELPDINQQITDAQQSIANINNEFDALFAGFEEPTIVTALNGRDAKSTSAIAALPHVKLRVPNSLWTTNSTSPVKDSKFPAEALQFVTNDPVFGECYQFTSGINETIGAAHPTEFDSDAIYKVTVRLRTLNDGTTSGCGMKIGVTTWDATTLQAQNVEKWLTGTPLLNSAGEQTYEVYFSDNLSLLQDKGYSIGSTATDEAIYINSLAAATDAFFHVRQNAEFLTNGQACIASFKIENVTQVALVEASVTTVNQAVTDIQGNSAASFSLAVVAGQEDAGLQIVASDSPNSDGVSSLRMFADNIVLEGEVYARHLNAEVFNADLINAGQMSVDHVVVDKLLRVNAAEGGIAVGKFGAYDKATDGAYFGRTEENDGTTGFGFSASRIDTTGRKQSLEITKKNGVQIQNANFVRELGVAPFVQNLTTSNTYPIGALTQTINLSIQAAGGGGGNGEDTELTPGQDGGNTVVELRDGTTLIASWTASGGTGGSSAVNTGTSAAGQDSAVGNGGTAGRGRYTTTETAASGENRTTTYTVVHYATAGGNATGYGAGGGAGGDPNAYQAAEGGKAGQLKVFEDIDVSNLVDPKIVVTIGPKGLGSTSAEKYGGNGSDGLVKLQQFTTEIFAADVIPIKPTFNGTMMSHGPFPDHGAGFWVLHRDVASTLDFGYLEFDDTGNSYEMLNAGMSTFISTKTPVVLTTPYTNRTIKYRFHKMGP